MQKDLTTCLWFNGNVEQAAEFYCSVFPNGRVVSVSPMVVTFEIMNQKFMGLNGGPHFTFNEAVSFVIHCDTQQEIDFYWEKLTEGGQESMCGWLKDKFGVSWQVVPSNLGELMSSPDRASRVTKAFMSMKKLDMDILSNV